MIEGKSACLSYVLVTTAAIWAVKFEELFASILAGSAFALQ